MKWSASTLAAALFLAASSSSSSADAFTPTTASKTASIRVAQPSRKNHVNIHTQLLTKPKTNVPRNTKVNMASSSSGSAYTVGIVGATGAVGKEIRNCLEIRKFPVSTLRIFGSERSAGNKIETEKYGTITVELFDVDAAKQCDVVFLAVSGEFSKEHARALSDGPDGCVVIDNSVRMF